MLRDLPIHSDDAEDAPGVVGVSTPSTLLLLLFAAIINPSLGGVVAHILITTYRLWVHVPEITLNPFPFSHRLHLNRKLLLVWLSC